jgi:hypothetical protein
LWHDEWVILVLQKDQEHAGTTRKSSQAQGARHARKSGLPSLPSCAGQLVHSSEQQKVQKRIVQTAKNRQRNGDQNNDPRPFWRK